MSLKRPLISFLSGIQAQSKGTLHSFGERRAQQLGERLNKAIRERRLWTAVEHTADNPVSTYAQAKGEMVERTIGRLSTDAKKDV